MSRKAIRVFVVVVFVAILVDAILSGIWTIQFHCGEIVFTLSGFGPTLSHFPMTPYWEVEVINHVQFIQNRFWISPQWHAGSNSFAILTPWWFVTVTWAAIGGGVWRLTLKKKPHHKILPRHHNEVAT